MKPNLNCSKTKFSTEENAKFYVEKLKKTSTRNKVPIRTYLCEHCLQWHLTSANNEETRIEKYKAEIKRLGAEIHKLTEIISKLKSKK